jgi:hypothetical protein
MHPVVTLACFRLKYCERCGGLWLRPDGVQSVYCPACEEFMAELPLRARRPPRKIIRAAAATTALALLSTIANLAQTISECAA